MWRAGEGARGPDLEGARGLLTEVGCSGGLLRQGNGPLFRVDFVYLVKAGGTSARLAWSWFSLRVKELCFVTMCC